MQNAAGPGSVVALTGLVHGERLLVTGVIIEVLDEIVVLAIPPDGDDTAAAKQSVECPNGDKIEYALVKAPVVALFMVPKFLASRYISRLSGLEAFGLSKRTF